MAQKPLRDYLDEVERTQGKEAADKEATKMGKTLLKSGRYALAGASAGSAIPVVGTVAGGTLGAIWAFIEDAL